MTTHKKTKKNKNKFNSVIETDLKLKLGVVVYSEVLNILQVLGIMKNVYLKLGD